MDTEEDKMDKEGKGERMGGRLTDMDEVKGKGNRIVRREGEWKDGERRGRKN